MGPPGSGPRLQMQRLLLLLLLGVAAVPYCRCSYSGMDSAAEDVAPEPTETDEPVQLATATEAMPLATALEGPADSWATQAAASLAPSTQIGGVELEAKQTRLGLSHHSGHPSISLGIAVSLVMVLLAYVMLAERRVAAAQAMQQKEEEQGALATEGKTAIAVAVQREASFAESARQELEELQRQERVTVEALQELARRRDDLTARAAQALAEASAISESNVQQAQSRMRKALEKRNDQQLQLDVAQELAGITEDTASTFLERIKTERNLIEKEREKILASLQDLQAVTSLEDALELKKQQLASLEATLSTTEKEVTSMEAEVSASSEKLAGNAEACGREISSLEERKARLQREYDEAAKKGDQQAKESENLSKTVGATDSQMQALKTQLTELSKAPLLLTMREKALEEAQKVLQESQRKILALTTEKAGEAAPAGADDSEALDKLYPEERMLLEAKQQVHKLESQKEILLAEQAVYDDTAEQTAWAKALQEFLKAKASSTGDQLAVSGSEVETEVHSSQLEEAQAAVNFAQAKLDRKKLRRETVRQKLEELEKQLPLAHNNLERCERRVKDLEGVLQLRTESPTTFAFAKLELQTRNLTYIEYLLKRVYYEHFDFSPEMFDQIPDNMPTYTFWKATLQPRVDDYLLGVTKMNHWLVDLRKAEAKARDHLFELQTIEELQEFSFEELLNRAAAGPEGEWQRETTEKRWNALQEELREVIAKQKESEAAVAEVKEGLDKLAVAEYWSEELPKLQTFALSYMVSEEQKARSLANRRAELEAMKKPEVQDQVQRCFIEAVLQAKRRIEMFGEDPKMLEALHGAVDEAVEETGDHLDSFRTLDEEYSETFTPPFTADQFPSTADLPKQEPSEPSSRDEREFGGEIYEELPVPDSVTSFDDGFTGMTFGKVLQLRKGTSRKGNP